MLRPLKEENIFIISIFSLGTSLLIIRANLPLTVAVLNLTQCNNKVETDSVKCRREREEKMRTGIIR